MFNCYTGWFLVQKNTIENKKLKLKIEVAGNGIDSIAPNFK